MFFFNDTATTEIYTLSLHDALPISSRDRMAAYFACRSNRFAQWANWDRSKQQSSITTVLNPCEKASTADARTHPEVDTPDRKSTRLNSSHANISYAVFCLKKKKKQI